MSGITKLNASPMVDTQELDITDNSLKYQTQNDVFENVISPNEIQLVCSLFPFEDPDTRVRILSQRYHFTLNAILSPLLLKDHNFENQQDGDIKLYKAKEFLKRTAPEPPNLSIWDWNWNHPIPSSTVYATMVAHHFDKQMSTAFSRVPFAALVKGACGYQAAAITELLACVIYTRLEICHRFQKRPQSKDEYKLVENDLQNRNPIAYWAVSTNLFKGQDLPLIPMLQRVPLLKVLHQEHILNGDDTQ
ncbi:hypothetical protein B0O99DRAFT_688722 [Bisporella sp. PMI_857]|nr:hypothetical protein B0O99DRAFT_688722 [Bisporella sp. PMI_857]